MRHQPSTVLSVLLAAGLWIAGAAPALAHEDAVLEVDRSAVAPGDSLVLDGSDFGEGGEYQLRLVGTLDEHDLAKVRADSAGRFRVEVSVPSDVRPGRFRIVAVAGDGDEVASAELRITDRATASSIPDTAAGESSSSRRPRTDEMDLARERSGLEWGLIVLLIGGTGGLGAFVVRRPEAGSMKNA